MATMPDWRERLHGRQGVLTVVALAVLLFSLWFIYKNLFSASSPPPVRDVYYYDLGTKQLFVAKNTDLPPIQTASGAKNGVQAWVYGCGDCAEKNRFIAYLQRYTDAGQRALQAAKDAGPKGPLVLPTTPDAGIEVSAADGTQWWPFNSVEAQKLMVEGPAGHCPSGTRPVLCTPGR
jgi:hypothetical protein